MYYDIFLSNPNATFEQGPDGVIIDMPGNNTGIVYAASERLIDNSQDYEEGEEVTIEHGYIHCLVTEEQLAQLEADNFPFKFFNQAANRFKRGGTGPNHVFNPAGCAYKRNGTKYIHKVGADEEEERDPVEEQQWRRLR